MKKYGSIALSLAFVATLGMGFTGCGSDDDNDAETVEKAITEALGGGSTGDVSSTDNGNANIGDLTSYSVVLIMRNINQEEVENTKSLSDQVANFHAEAASEGVTCPSLGYSTFIEEDDSPEAVTKVYTADYSSYCGDTTFKNSYYNSGSESLVVYYNYN